MRVESIGVGSWREGRDNSSEGGICADDTSSTEQQWDLPADGIENQDNEAIRNSESSV